MQKKFNFKKLCSLCLCILLVAAIAMLTTACTKDNNGPAVSTSVEEMGTYGQGETAFTFVVSDKEGKEFYYSINTDKKTVGEALMELGLIDGEQGVYGIYVKTVKDVTLDYEKDGMYWAFYIGEEMAPTGADMTNIENGAVYKFVATKG